MDRSAHSPDGSDTPQLDDAVVERLLAGDPGAVAEHPELADLLADVRVAYRGGLPRVSDPLAALLSPQTLAPAARSTPMATTAPRRLARFALAVVVTAIASGGLALAGALPAPLSDDTADDTTETTVDTTVPDTTVPDTEPEPTLPDDSEADEESEYKNHGQEVSEFARTTELEGCEKGRAVSELASGKDLSHRPPCAASDDEADDPEADDPEVDDPEADEHDDEDDGVDTESERGPGNRDEAPGHAKH